MDPPERLLLALPIGLLVNIISADTMTPALQSALHVIVPAFIVVAVICYGGGAWFWLTSKSIWQEIKEQSATKRP
jgi:cytochrome c oxidase assembly factor CtaG